MRGVEEVGVAVGDAVGVTGEAVDVATSINAAAAIPSRGTFQS